MKKIFIALLALATIKNVHSQNVGIGTTTPGYPLTVSNLATHTLASFEHQSGNLRFKVDPSFNIAHIYSNQMISLTAGSPQPSFGTLNITTDGNLGIGTLPSTKLDVNGRIKLRHTTNTAGIWYDGPDTQDRAFIGLINQDHVGIYGGGGLGWSFAMNLNNGNTGIGVTAPTAKLDVNGGVRIREAGVKKGSILTSNDVNGNAQWADPVAFRVAGLPGTANVNLVEDTWHKIEFNTTPGFNLGFYYQPLQSQFFAAERGIYQFNAQLVCDPTRPVLGSKLRLRLNRGGNVSNLAQLDINQGTDGNAQIFTPVAMNFSSGSVQLEVGDIVWLEFNPHWVISTGGGQVTEVILLNNTAYTWFSGSLVARN